MPGMPTTPVPKSTMNNTTEPTGDAALQSKIVDAEMSDCIDTLMGVTMLLERAQRGDRTARALLRRFDRGEPIDALGVPMSWL
jgi:hypothetical protein